MNQKTKNLVGIGLFTAIIVALQLLGGGIRFGVFSISLVLVPIVVGSAVYGWYAGLWLGCAFGMAVLLSGDAGVFLAVNPLATIVVVLVKGAMCGLVAGLVYRVVGKLHQVAGVVTAAILCPVVNTGIFLIGCKLFFLETVAAWAVESGFPNVGNYLFLGLAGFNFLIELGVNLVLAPIITRLIHIARR